MIESAWLQVGRIAFLWTVFIVAVAIYADPREGVGDGIVTVGGAVGFVLWGVWTFGALNIQTLDGGSEFTYTHPEIAILGVALALLPGYLALTGPLELVGRATRGDLDEF